MIYVKQHYRREQYEEAFVTLWKYLSEHHVDISKPENMSKALREHFVDEEVGEILEAASTPQYKQALTDNTQKAIELGAFGAPFFWVHNKKGQEEPFFGSDRFHYMWEYLGIPWSDIFIREKAKL
jgi:glutathione S-transferase kappa 1